MSQPDTANDIMHAGDRMVFCRDESATSFRSHFANNRVIRDTTLRPRLGVNVKFISGIRMGKCARLEENGFRFTPSTFISFDEVIDGEVLVVL